VQASDIPRAVAAAGSSAEAFDLRVDDAVVLHDSNRLAETDSPIAALEPRVEPRVYVRDGFVVTLWTYYEPVSPRDVEPAEYAQALKRLHAGMRQIDVTAAHFTDRVAEAERLVGNRAHTPELADADRELLSNTLRSLKRAIGERGAAEQLLHGEPHR